ncbi:serine O-acetyltransferase EpsC [Hoylesella buccalis]|uniref:serine O-acetyltransferase n=1 Tax=Hoylesella buccalis DNF00853 TaxID=1401074 RepID=A0A096BWQ2_9BACT|nr:serine O-acetyltransferase EpsC [Hoylesella buccalis]KGF37534.1 serine acetyltransferase [Hoylesella buccalis DNF00853]
MSKDNLTHALTSTVEQLSQPESLNNLCHRQRDGYPLPSGKTLQEIIDLSRAILFPGYYGKASVNIQTIQYYIGVNVERFQRLIEDQILAGLRFCEDRETTLSELEADEHKKMARDLSFKLVKKLPEIREKLSTDVIAAYNGDPASESRAEIIACYPIIKTLANYRIAHELYLLNVPLIPRMMTEMAHSETGIDIHPGAHIGRYFTIDHGTGVVIGATCTIGDNVKIYQGVTLGAKSFPLDERGNPVKGIPRHPIIEDNVIIYANATILGRVTIGKGSVIGANVWVTEDLAPDTKKYNKN